MNEVFVFIVTEIPHEAFGYKYMITPHSNCGSFDSKSEEWDAVFSSTRSPSTKRTPNSVLFATYVKRVGSEVARQGAA